MSRRIGYVSVLTLTLGAACFLGTRHLRSQALLTAKRTPFTMRVQERIFLNDTGPALNEKAYLFAVRSDGSTSQVFLGTDDNGQEIPVSRSIRDLSGMKKIVVAEKARSITTPLFSKHAILSAKAHSTDPTCISDAPYLTRIGSGEHLGYKVIKLQDTGNSSVILEHWAAPDLDCDHIYSKWYFKNSDGSLHHTVEQSAVSITPGEPQPEFFSPPVNAVEKQPSGVVRDLMNR